jgi:hypothetical protein
MTSELAFLQSQRYPRDLVFFYVEVRDFAEFLQQRQQPKAS